MIGVINHEPICESQAYSTHDWASRGDTATVILVCDYDTSIYQGISIAT